MTKTYYDKTDTIDGTSGFIEALAHLLSACSPNVESGLSVQVEENESTKKWQIVIECHSPCDRSSHADCAVVGSMDSGDFGNYSRTYTEACSVAQVLSEAMHQDINSLTPEKKDIKDEELPSN